MPDHDYHVNLNKKLAIVMHWYCMHAGELAYNYIMYAGIVRG